MIAERLRALRGTISQGEIARRAGIAQTSLSEFERGVSTPTRPVLIRLLDALGAPTEEREALGRFLVGLDDSAAA
jgi:transcriptional regulator with XRE-family HTH domain